MELGRKHNLPFVQHVDIRGYFLDEVTDFKGLNVKPKGDHMSTDIEIVKFLAHKNMLFAKQKYEHSYPHCWRCDTPLLNYATSSWFVAVEKMKDKLLEYAENINWSPKHVKDGRWGTWLAGAKDWSISRQRFWANTIPVWRCGSCDKEVVIGSIDELQQKSGVRIDDLHRDVVDGVVWSCECGGEMKRIPDVFDTWFDSGSVPFATMHYPFDNQDEFKKRIPVDFIAEAQDQCRAWFYYQHVLAGGLFETRAFNNCVVTGMVLAEDGKKQSKKLKNYPDPMYMIDKYGADAVRLYILSSPVLRMESLRFKEKEVAELSRRLFGRLVNVCEFYRMYGADMDYASSLESEHVLDRWIVARLSQIHGLITYAMENYELDRAARHFEDFVDDLSAWYLRRSRDRFKGEDAVDKRLALETTRWVLKELAKLLAPFAPFHADWIWKYVKEDGDPVSVHLSSWSDERKVNTEILRDMEQVRILVTKALDARSNAGFNIRQPLSSLKFAKKSFSFSHDTSFLKIIADELNVKRVEPSDDLSGEIELDLKLTPELIEEGKLREMIREIQKERKRRGLKPGEYVYAVVQVSDDMRNILSRHKNDITKQTFVAEFVFEDVQDKSEFVIKDMKMS